MQPVLADAIATNRVRHPYIRFTWSESPWIAKDLDAQLQYNTPGVQLQFPPEWVNLTGSLEVATVPGFNLTIPVRTPPTKAAYSCSDRVSDFDCTLHAVQILRRCS